MDNVDGRVMTEEEDKEQWLNALMDLYGEALTNLAYTYTRDWGKSQEIVQDVFITCYRDFFISDILFGPIRPGSIKLR